MTVFLIALICIYIFKDRIVIILDWILKVLFVICVILAVSAIFIPSIYQGLARTSLENAGTLKTLRDIDAASDINKIIEPGQQILNNIGNFLAGSPSITPTPTNTPVFAGRLERDVYPGLVNGLAGIYIILVLVISLGGISGVIYFSYTTSALREASILQGKYKKLEAKVQKLEGRLDETNAKTDLKQL